MNECLEHRIQSYSVSFERQKENKYIAAAAKRMGWNLSAVYFRIKNKNKILSKPMNNKSQIILIGIMILFGSSQPLGFSDASGTSFPVLIVFEGVVCASWFLRITCWHKF